MKYVCPGGGAFPICSTPTVGPPRSRDAQTVRQPSTVAPPAVAATGAASPRNGGTRGRAEWKCATALAQSGVPATVAN